MALFGIPISEDQCIGDSLDVINGAFEALDAKTSVPTGTVLLIANRTTPDGFLLCDGTRVLKSVYPGLYDTLTSSGTNFVFGADQKIGDDISFVLPNLSAGDMGVPETSSLINNASVYIKT